MTDNSAEQRLQQLEDRIAIKEVVDTFSKLADANDIPTQMHLLTEDAVVDTYFGDALFASLKGRAEIEKVFSSFSANFEATYHFNGQQIIELNGDNASSDHCCQVVQIASSGGKKTLTTNGVIYHDAYVRRPDGWKIAKRIARFTWRTTGEMSAA